MARTRVRVTAWPPAGGEWPRTTSAKVGAGHPCRARARAYASRRAWRVKSTSRTSTLHLTDVGNGSRFVAEHGEDVRYVYDTGNLIIYDGRRWVADTTMEIERRAKETTRSMLLEAATLEEQKRADLAKHALASQQNPRIKAMIDCAMSEKEIGIKLADLDADPWAFTVENGTIDLRTGQLSAHCREAYATKYAP